MDKPSQNAPFAREEQHHEILAPSLLEFLGNVPAGSHILDVGCGTGFISGLLIEKGYRVTGIDFSDWCIRRASEQYPNGNFYQASADDPNLPGRFPEPFDAVVSVEVIEHLYSPSTFLKNCHQLLKPGGQFILTTPYHGFLKNLGIVLTGRFDSHFSPIAEGGHIKFWTERTLRRALDDHGFRVTGFRGCGRVSFFWQSMILQAQINVA